MINDSGRKKLTIVTLLEKRKVGEAEVQEFTAKVEGEEATGKHGVWSKVLYEYIKEGATLDCDVVTKKSEKSDPDGNPYWNRKISQIYIDGKPIAQSSSKQGWQPRQDNPEQRRSIERQVAAKLALEFSPQPTLLGKLCDAEIIYTWIAGGDISFLKEAPQTVKTGEDTTPTTKVPPDATIKAKTTALTGDAKQLVEAVKKLSATDKAWSKENILLFFKKTYNVEAKAVTEAVPRLNELQFEDYKRKVEEALKKLPEEVDPEDIPC